MPLAADRHTNKRDGKTLSIPVAAGVVIYAGAQVAVNAAGFAVPGSESAALTYMGRAEAQVDNTGGAAGDINVQVLRGQAFKWANSATDPVDQSCMGQVCYIEDDETVSKTDNAEARSASGKVIAIDDDGVWVL